MTVPGFFTHPLGIVLFLRTVPMNIKKLRLLTPGPTPLYPPAVRAMAGANIHHRTEDFRKLYRQVLEGLKYFMGTQNDVVLFTSSGTGAMESAASNLFAPGERVLVASAGTFGERWVEITRAFGLDVEVIEAPYGEAVSPQRIAEACRAFPALACPAETHPEACRSGCRSWPATSKRPRC